MNMREIGQRMMAAVTGKNASKKKQQADNITFFDVKDLYNRAYEHKAQARNALRQYRRMAREAEALDEAYRTQLGLITRKAA